MLRYLRIAFSATCGILYLLLIALWVRSYQGWDTLYYPYGKSGNVFATSVLGVLRFSRDQDSDTSRVSEFRQSSAEEWLDVGGSPEQFEWMSSSGFVEVAFPHWIPVAISAVLAAVFWIRLPKRFSLRTLLIAMTLVAVVLGAIAVSMR